MLHLYKHYLTWPYLTYLVYSVLTLKGSFPTQALRRGHLTPALNTVICYQIFNLLSHQNLGINILDPLKLTCAQFANIWQFSAPSHNLKQIWLDLQNWVNFNFWMKVKIQLFESESSFSLIFFFLELNSSVHLPKNFYNFSSTIFIQCI